MYKAIFKCAKKQLLSLFLVLFLSSSGLRNGKALPFHLSASYQTAMQQAFLNRQNILGMWSASISSQTKGKGMFTASWVSLLLPHTCCSNAIALSLALGASHEWPASRRMRTDMCCFCLLSLRFWVFFSETVNLVKYPTNPFLLPSSCCSLRFSSAAYHTWLR